MKRTGVQMFRERKAYRRRMEETFKRVDAIFAALAANDRERVTHCRKARDQ